MKTLRNLTLMALVAFGALLWWGSTLPSESAVQRIHSACAREFPGDLEAAQACEIRLSVEVLAKAEAERMDRARRAVG